MSDGIRTSHLPWLMGLILLVIGGAKFEATRPYEATAMALAVPVVVVAMGVTRLREGDLLVERLAVAVGALAVIAAEICVAFGFFHVESLAALVPLAHWALYGAVAASVVVQWLSVQRGMNGRFCAWIGIAAVFAVYLSTHASRDTFGSVFGAFFVALFVGGGVGLLASELTARALKRA